MGRRLQGLTSFTLKRRPERVGAREPLGYEAPRLRAHADPVAQLRP